MLAALGVVLLYAGALVEVLDMSMAVIASLLCVFAVIEYGKGAPWLVFAVTSVLSILLSPRTPSIMYALFFGYYPILKEKYEKFKTPLAWLFKELTFNVALVAIFFAFKFMVLGSAAIPIELYIIFLVLCEVVFVVYDFALTKLISYYIFSLRKRFKIK
jgi:hypothetical protein